MGKIFPLVLALIGLGAGVGTGWMLRPSVAAVDAHANEPAPEGAEAHTPEAEIEGEHAVAAPAADGAEGGTDEHGNPTGPEYVKLSNQFIVPVVEEGRVSSMVILSLSLEVTSGSTEAVFAMEPKLRDRFLQVLFDHANAGGFKGAFTDGANLVVLRRALMETASQTAGDMVLDVLIADIARQDS
jgi:flagellar FliL protein